MGSSHLFKFLRSGDLYVPFNNFFDGGPYLMSQWTAYPTWQTWGSERVKASKTNLFMLGVSIFVEQSSKTPCSKSCLSGAAQSRCWIIVEELIRCRSKHHKASWLQFPYSWQIECSSMVELKFTLLFCYFLTAITWMHRENQCYISECVL